MYACVMHVYGACVCVHVCVYKWVHACVHTCMCIYTHTSSLPVFLLSGGLPNVQHAMLLVNTKLLTICGRCVTWYIRVLNLLFFTANKKALGLGLVCHCYCHDVLTFLAFRHPSFFSSRSPQVATADILLMTLFICRHFLEDPTQDEPPIFDGGWAYKWPFNIV